MNGRGGIGQQHDHVTGGTEAGVGEPVETDDEAVTIIVIQLRHRGIGQHHVGGFNDDDQIVFELMARTAAELAQQFQGRRWGGRWRVRGAGRSWRLHQPARPVAARGAVSASRSGLPSIPLRQLIQAWRRRFTILVAVEADRAVQLVDDDDAPTD